MLKSYIVFALRNLSKNKGYSLINIGGLALGMALAILIALWAKDEFSFNRYHKNYDRIAYVLQNITFAGETGTWGSQVLPLGNELRTNYADNFEMVVMATFNDAHYLSLKEKTVSVKGNFMESKAPELLSLEMIQGSYNALEKVNSILLSSSSAKALFGHENPIGKVLKIDNEMEAEVAGVYKDIPYNSEFRNLKFIASFDLLIASRGLQGDQNWVNNWIQIFVKLAPNIDIQKASVAIRDAKIKNVSKEDAASNPVIFLYPMSKWHLYFDFKNGVEVGGNIKYVRLFIIIGLFVLLIACINFMNLSTARSSKRAKEVGVRKVIGSGRGQLISQFYIESILVSFFAFILSILIVQLSLPIFNQVSDKDISILWDSPIFWLACLSFTFITGLIAGSYPALFLSSFRPVKVLKGAFKVGRAAAIPRKILVVTQFTVSISLIIGVWIVYRQIEFGKERPIGYDLNGLLTIEMKTGGIFESIEPFRNELLKSGKISEVALSECTITNTWVSNFNFQWKGKDPNLRDNIFTGAVSHEFGKTVGWKIKEGRDFSRTHPSDSLAFILNEAAVKFMGLKNPVGENIKVFGRTFTVIGVVEDMVTQSLYQPIKETVFYIDIFKRSKFINIKIDPKASAQSALAVIEPAFKKHYPEAPFEFNFADVEFAHKYAYEEQIGKLAGIFTLLAVFISILGLFGLASFVAEQRTKEIGVRKVLGASVVSLWNLLSRDFALLVSIAFLIAAPISWYFMNHWLQDYHYRTKLSWWVFALAGTGSLMLALITVSFQTIRAAIVNPVKSLRSE